MKADLVVPFLMCNTINRENYAWIFCKYADFCIKNSMPIIVEEEYCLDKELVKKYNEGFNPQEFYYTAPSPSEHVINTELKKVLITKNEREEYLKGMDIDNSNESRGKLCIEENEAFESLINVKIDEIEELYGKISVILTWIRYPALVQCAEKRGIKVLTQELSIVRGNGYYKEVLGYFNFVERYTSKYVCEQYEAFKNVLKSEIVLNRKEILALVLQTEHLDVLNRLDESIYEIGVDADPDRDIFFLMADVSKEDMFEGIKKLVDEGNILARYHPATRPDVSELGFDVDASENSLEWILKCRRIVTAISNVGFEAMLLGRTAYILSENVPYYIGNVHCLSNIEDGAASNEVLNYFLFGYFVPWDLMFDCEYINWRLSSPDIVEIYRYHLSYLLNKIGLDYKSVVKMTPIERYKRILSCVHHLSEERLYHYIKRSKSLPYTQMKQCYEEKIKTLEKQYMTEIQLMQNSKSWKLTKPLRNAGVKIRKAKKILKRAGN